MCLEVPPAPVYKGAGEGAAVQEEGAPGGVLLPPGVGFPPSLVGLGEKEGGEGGRKGGALPPPSPIRTRGGGGRVACPGLLSLSPLWPNKAHTLTGGFR